jgi:hypothetical protein
MIRVAGALRRSCVLSIGLSSAGRNSAQPSTLLLARLASVRYNWNSADSQDRPRRPSYRRPDRESRFSGEDGLELGGSSNAPKDFSQSKSLHVSRLPAEITDEEFKNAFSNLKGLTSAELGGNRAMNLSYLG